MHPKLFKNIAALMSTPQAPPSNPEIVRLERFKCEDIDGEKFIEMRACRDWCSENCAEPVFIQWHFETNSFVPVAYCSNGIDAVHLALRWVGPS